MPGYYLLTMVLSLVKAKLWPASAETSRAKAAEQLLRTGYRFYTWKNQAEAERSLRQNVSLILYLPSHLA